MKLPSASLGSSATATGKTPEPTWSRARKLLCVRLDYMGDVLMCTPAMRALRDSLPQRQLTLLTSPGGAAVAPMVPELDQVMVYEAPWMKSSRPHPPQDDLAFVEQLREQAFDGAVIFTTYSQSALPAAQMCMLAGIPLRLAHCRENPYALLTDWVPDPEPGSLLRHEVQRQLDLVANIGCHTDALGLSFQPSCTAREKVHARLAELGLGESGWILLHPGASAPSRRWPASHWQALADRIAQDLQCVPVFSGGRDEAALIAGIASRMREPSISVAGEFNLDELGALIAAAPAMVCNNTGPAHVAAALATPLVELYALTNPQHTPWMGHARVLSHAVPCRNCYKSVCPQGHHDCLEKVMPQQAFDALCELLQEARTHTPFALTAPVLSLSGRESRPRLAQ